MSATSRQIRVQIPYHLRNLAHIDGEVTLAVAPPVSTAAVLDALEARYPMLAGTIRDHDTLKRRPFLRFFACEEDLSLQPLETPLPEAVAEGREPFVILGAIAGGVDSADAISDLALKLPGLQANPIRLSPAAASSRESPREVPFPVRGSAPSAR